MDKRTFLKTGAFATAAVLASPLNFVSCQNPNAQQEDEPQIAGNFELPPLPYEFGALEPHIDAMTMEIHHDRHYQGYVNKANAAVEGTKYAEMTLNELIEAVEPGDAGVRNNGGGHFNHSLFWKVMSPDGGGAPSGRMADFLNGKFGSFDTFKEQFNGAATGQFGSGWAWLCVNDAGDLFVTSTPNQDNPMMKNVVAADQYGMPILGIDVWEHAYYLKYQNKRGDYVGNFWNLVNWDQVNANYDAAMEKFG